MMLIAFHSKRLETSANKMSGWTQRRHDHNDMVLESNCTSISTNADVASDALPMGGSRVLDSWTPRMADDVVVVVVGGVDFRKESTLAVQQTEWVTCSQKRKSTRNTRPRTQPVGRLPQSAESQPMAGYEA